MIKRFSPVPPECCQSYDWLAGHLVVMVFDGETGGQHTLMEDNLKALEIKYDVASIGSLPDRVWREN